MKSILFFLVLGMSSSVFAWGGRGHDSICRTAVFLVKEKGLKDYLQNKPQMLGHLCNMPDFYWKSIGPDVSKLGNPTHYVDLEIISSKVQDIPTDYKKLMADYTGKPNKFKNGATIFSVPTEFGSSWWRADQFYRRIISRKADFEKAPVPANRKEEQDDTLAYNKLAFDMIIDMGLMGHFVGDNSQPLHVSADHDGWAVGHGGIHSYYEDDIVGEFDGDLDARVLKEARGLKDPVFLKPATVIEKMKALSEISHGDLKKVIALDPIIKTSTVKSDKGMEIRTPAERQPATVGYKRMNKMIVSELARSALLLANIWDDAYVKTGSPKLAAFKSYKYPFTVDFIAPDYFTEEPKKEESKK